MASYFAGTLPADPLFDDNDDLLVLQDALLEIYSDEEPIDYGDSPIDAGASGTALRFVLALCASTPGADYVITGTDRLMKRPMAPLIDLLREAGGEIEALGEKDTGPYRVKGKILEGGAFQIRGDISSQFISALMLVSPSWEKGMDLSFTTSLVSRPYVEMTAKLMKKFGIKPSLSSHGVTVPHDSYIEPLNFKVEADWSSASFFYEAAAIGAPEMFIENLPSPKDSLQGDSVAAALFNKIGVMSSFESKGVWLKRGEASASINEDFKDCPDLVLPFAVACLCDDVNFRLINIAHLRDKESDRLESLRVEAEKLGYKIKIDEDFIEWKGEKINPVSDPIIDTHDDHRVAMAFAMVALKRGEIKIRNPRVVEKSFINFWNQLPGIGLKCEEQEDVMVVRK